MSVSLVKPGAYLSESYLRTHPCRRLFGQDIQGMMERFPDKCQAVEVLHSRYDMGRIRALCAPGAQQSPLDKQPKHLGEEAFHGLPCEQARPKLTQDRKITSGIREVQAQRILPINAPPHRIRRLTVGEVLGTLS